MRIKFIVPFPFGEEGIANRAVQIPTELLGADTQVECVPVRNSGTLLDSYYESVVFDMSSSKPACGRRRRATTP